MRFILYARKSTEGDERQVQSIPDQHAVLTRIAQQDGLHVVETIDEARSAKQPGTRPGFERMIEILKAGDAEGILCWHLNRLSRNPVDSGTLSWLLQNGRISLIRTADREYRPDDNVVVMAVENAVSNQFIVDLRRNVQRGQREKALRGWYPHKPPPGYRTDPESREIVPDEQRYELVRRAWDLMLTGAYSVMEVRARLEGWGYRHRRAGKLGRPINKSGIYALFDNPFYYGEFVFAGHKYTGKHQAMVSREEFAKVQGTIHKSEPFSQRKPEFAYTGLVRCGTCGCRITAEQKLKHLRTRDVIVRYTYYRCTRSKGCREPSVTGPYLDQEFASILQKIRISDGLLEWLDVSLQKQLATTASDAENARRQLEESLTDCATKRSRLLELRLSNEITAEEFAEVSEKLSDVSNASKQQIEKLDVATTRFESSVLNAARFANKAITEFATGDVKTKRKIATALIKSAQLASSKLTVELHPILAPLLALEPSKNGNDKVQIQDSAHAGPVMQGWLDYIRTEAVDNCVSFPETV